MLILSQDAFYNHHTEEEIAVAMNNDFDFGEELQRVELLAELTADHPDSIDMGLFAKVRGIPA